MINDKVLIIAEAGVNHNGSFTIAKKLVDVAKLYYSVLKFSIYRLITLIFLLVHTEVFSISK